jgi:hypothetical protein
MGPASSIIVLGGPAAGKTVYPRALYHHLWQGHDGMLMRAGSGGMHAELLANVAALQTGTVPPATQALKHYEFELEYQGRNYQLRYLDYPGEVFRKVFFDLAIDSDESRELTQICESASGVLVLIDPQSVFDNASDIDYSLSNLIRFYDARPEKPQFVLAFTKRDINQELITETLSRFVRTRLPHTARMRKRGHSTFRAEKGTFYFSAVAEVG